MMTTAPQRIDFTAARPFQPARLLRNNHVQTVLANVKRPKTGVTFRRERLNTPDGDFIDIDLADVDGRTWTDLGPEAPIVLHLHGLEGNARRGYSYELYRQLAARGLRPAGMNFRSCSGPINRAARMYHAGATDDVHLVVEWLRDRFPAVPLGLCGVSLGGNMTVKYVGERGHDLPPAIQAAAAISPPFDMEKSAPLLTEGAGWLYGYRFLRCLRKKVRAKRPILHSHLDVESVLSATNLLEFDHRATAALHGFEDAWDYYRQNGCGQFLPDVRRPLLLIRAQDDPLMDPSDIPYTAVAENNYLHGLFPPHGGHVGFVQRNKAGELTFWAEATAADFLAAHLQPEKTNNEN